MNDTAERIRRLIETRGMSARSLSEAAGDLSPMRLAAETGMPWWAAALRLDMTAVML